MINKFGIILVKPQLGENIGACARSMKNFGIKNLSLVSPKFTFPNHKTKVTSVGAIDIISKTRVFNNTRDALNNYDIVISFSARRRDINKKHIKFADLFKIIKNKKYKSFGLVFGRESSGLSNEDLSYSNFILQIPTTKKFKSLNLSHAVTLVCYEIFKNFNKSIFKKNGKNLKVSSKLKISKLLKYLTKQLESKNFFMPIEKKQSMILNLNNLIYRLEPNDKELRILASIISFLSKKNNKP